MIGLFTAMAASAASVPASLKSKIASDDQLATVIGGSGVLGGGTPSITMPKLILPGGTAIGGKTITVFVPTITITTPTTPVIQTTPIFVQSGGTWTITAPTITITKPATKVVVVAVTTPIVTRK